jgi:5-methyltetrahydropteroyltriglutamate--homocysteine methyltransferase
VNGLWTTSVGSFPKTPELIRARADHEAGRLTDLELRELERQATEDWINFQEEIGIDLLVDGEMNRGDMVTYFARELSGFELGGLVRTYGNRYYRKPIAVGEVARPHPITVEQWKFAQSLTKRPIKAVLTGPYTLAEWSFNEHYPSRREFVLHLARLIHDEAVDLVAAGARFVQIDEPAASTRADELPLVHEALDIVTRGLGAHTITHVCYGDIRPSYRAILNLPVDQVDFEMANSGFELLERLRGVTSSKAIGIGVIDSHNHRVESVDQVMRAVSVALEVVPAERLFIDPDCGLRTRTVEEARAKMRVIAEAVRRIRAERRIGTQLPDVDPIGVPWPGPLPLPDRM